MAMTGYFQLDAQLIGDVICFVEMGCASIYATHRPGEAIADWNSRQIGVYGPWHFVELDYIEPNGGPFPLFSAEFQRESRKRFNEQIQFLPVRLQRLNGTSEIATYSLGNVLTVRDCLDRERTDGWYREDGYFVASQALTLRDPAFPNGIFRTKEGHVIVSDSFRSMCTEMGFTGVAFTDCEVF